MEYNEDMLEKLTQEFYKKVGTNVCNKRREKGISQLELARLLNFKSVSSISNSEICYKNHHHFSIGQLYKISLVLDIDMKELI